MKKRRRGRGLLFAVLLSTLAAPLLFGQAEASEPLRYPSAVVESRTHPSQTSGRPAYYILDGTPMNWQVHHDTEVGTGKKIDVDMLVIEMQVMNSDGNPEPVGLQFFNFFTAEPQDPKHDVNPHNARDCGIWYGLVQLAEQTRNPLLMTWPYMEFITSTNARVIQTNEDGKVYWSDDIECWGSSDRFPPF